MSRALARCLGCALALGALASGVGVVPAATVELEYVDPDYHFAFRFPAGWKEQERPIAGEAGDVRIAIKSEAAPLFILAIMSPTGSSISKETFERTLDREDTVDRLIDEALGQIHGKMAQDLATSQTVVSGRQRRPFDTGIAFTIDATHVTPDGLTAVAGLHVVPFGKRYAIALLLVSRVDPPGPGTEMREKLFDSFRMTGERPRGTVPEGRGNGG